MRCTTLLALLLGVMIYVGLGALVFSTLEEAQERTAYHNLLATKEAFLQNNSCVTEVEINRLVKRVVSAVEVGLDASSRSANFSTRWDIASAFFFCGTIITTIGFGNLSPRTWSGQLFCVCYALVGIPMFGILLAGVSDHMGTVLRRAVAKIETLFLVRMVCPEPNLGWIYPDFSPGALSSLLLIDLKTGKTIHLQKHNVFRTFICSPGQNTHVENMSY